MVRKAVKGKAVSKANTFQLPDNLFYVCTGVLVLFILFFSFYNLGQLPARDWDEARHGVSGYEMQKVGGQIINTYLYAPDYWNLKPPLSFYGVQLGYLLFGYNLFGMRFYSALAFMLTAVCVGWFCKKRYGNLEAIMVLLLIICCAPFYSDHFARHGDADSLFSLFCVVSLLSMMMIEEKPWALYTCSGGFALAFLTKSWHALFIAAVVGVYMLWKKILLRLSLRQWMGFVAAGAIPILVWAAFRYRADGVSFFQKMVEVDLINRSTQILERHHGNWGYYINVLISFSPTTGYLPLFTAFMLAAYRLTAKPGDRTLPENPSVYADVPVLLLWVLLPLAVFSLVRTKLWWYVFPLYFPLLMATGILLAQMIRSVNKKYLFQKWLVIAVTAILLTVGVRSSWRVLDAPFQDTLQSILWQEKDALGSTRDKNAYISNTLLTFFDRGTQSYVLLGELYYNWRCSVDDSEAFLKDAAAQILLIDEAGYLANDTLQVRCKELLRRDGYLVLEKL